MGRLRRRQDAFRLGELHRRFEGGHLAGGDRFDVAVVVEGADVRRHAVVAQPAGVDARRHEGVAQRVHLDDRRHRRRVAVVEGVQALGQRRAGGRLDRHHPGALAGGVVLVQEGEGEAGEVAAPAHAADDHIRVLAGQLELLERLQPDHRLVHQDRSQHRAQRVLVLALRDHRRFDRLRDGDPQRARTVRVLGQELAAVVGLGRRAGRHRRPVGLHDDAPVGLLLVGDLHHVHMALQLEEVAGHRQRRAPLAGPRLGGEAGRPLFLRIVRLRHRRVRLVRSGRRDPLVLVVDVGRRLERLLQAPRPVERGRSPQLVDLPHLVGDVDEALGAHFLLDQLHREQRSEEVGRHGLFGLRMEHGRGRYRHVRIDVVPRRREVGLVELDANGFGHRASS